jgi:hypothetical protein
MSSPASAEKASRTTSAKFLRVTKFYENARVRSLRNAYGRVVDVRSPRPGYDGMVEEIREGTSLLAKDVVRLHAADHAVLEAAFFGATSVAILRAIARRAPSALAGLLAQAAPAGFGFMVGGIEHSGPNENFIPHCRFRAQGGPELCQHICKAGTERFCSEHLVPIRLQPASHDMSCRWTWGTRTEGGL